MSPSVSGRATAVQKSAEPTKQRDCAGWLIRVDRVRRQRRVDCVHNPARRMWSMAVDQREALLSCLIDRAESSSSGDQRSASGCRASELPATTMTIIVFARAGEQPRRLRLACRRSPQVGAGSSPGQGFRPEATRWRRSSALRADVVELAGAALGHRQCGCRGADRSMGGAMRYPAFGVMPFAPEHDVTSSVR